MHESRGQDDGSAREAAEQPRKAGRWRRYWPPIVIMALAGATIVWLQSTETIQIAATKFLATASCLALAGLLVAFWFIFFSGLPALTRWTLLALGLALAAVFSLTVRVEGVSGDMQPSLAWRWSPKADERLAAALDSSTDRAAAPVDLADGSPADFPQFLGKNRNAVVQHVRLARDWQASPPELVWRRPIGAGWSAFAVAGGYAVTQEQRGGKELVVCYELLSGIPRWSHADPGRYSSTIAGDGPRSTPTVFGGRVYAFGVEGRLSCLDGASGEVIWTRDVLAENGAKNRQWGNSCSPLIVDDLVVVSAGGPGGRSLVAYDRINGELAWSGGDDPASYSSPVLCTLGGVRQILIVNANSLASHDPADGRLLWRFQWQGGSPKVPQPLPLEPDQVFIAAGYGVGCKLLSLENLEGDFRISTVWENRLLKPKFTNVVVRDGFVYGLDDGRSLVCLDLATGQRVWRGGRYGHGQVLLIDDLRLVQTDAGEMVLAEANPE
ncbi:MAG: PQQ-binding-like beta-propeller repeat protein, partial [Pirellulales bacterium]